MSLIISTPLGAITLQLRKDAAPKSVEYYIKLAQQGFFDNSTFYRSDFVIQCGVHGLNRKNPLGDLPVNETKQGVRISNTRGTAAIAHFDVPDNGNSEFFINLQTNAHLDDVYGGYCVFAQVADGDDASFKVVDAIAAAIKTQKSVPISSIAYQS